MRSNFGKNLVLLFLFFLITPLTLGASLVALLTFAKNPQSANIPISLSGAKVYASLPSDFPSVSAEIKADDSRPEIVKQYLEKYNSPLAPYAKIIVSAADENKIDFRLTTAIAQQESNLCKIIPQGSHNCWGWGIHSEGTLGFSSYEEGIKVVSKGLAKEYFGKGYDTVEKIMSKYTPLSNGSWAAGITQFLSEME